MRRLATRPALPDHGALGRRVISPCRCIRSSRSGRRTQWPARFGARSGAHSRCYRSDERVAPHERVVGAASGTTRAAGVRRRGAGDRHGRRHGRDAVGALAERTRADRHPARRRRAGRRRGASAVARARHRRHGDRVGRQPPLPRRPRGGRQPARTQRVADEHRTRRAVAVAARASWLAIRTCRASGPVGRQPFTSPSWPSRWGWPSTPGARCSRSPWPCRPCCS